MKAASDRPPTSGQHTRPLPSATVVLLRDTPGGAELLLVLRHAKTSFGSTYVFPGGLLESDDAQVIRHCDGLDEAAANAALDVRDGGMAYFSAAIRELFEEAGVLLARTAAGDWADASGFAAERDALNAGSDSWLAFLERHDLRLACDALHYFSFWITPREIPKRFSTRFFAAALPDGQTASHCGTELTDSRWMSAQQALTESEREGFDLPHPTAVTLRELCRFGDTAATLHWACECCRRGVDCLLPATVIVDGERQVLMPGDPGYPEYADDND